MTLLSFFNILIFQIDLYNISLTRSQNTIVLRRTNQIVHSLCWFIKMALNVSRNFLLCIKGVSHCLSPNVWSQVSSQKVLFYVGSIKLENVRHRAAVN